MPSRSSPLNALQAEGAAAADLTDGTYRVELLGCPGVTESAAAQAIDIFRNVLDTRLGGAQGVLQHHAAYSKAIESIHTKLSHADAEAAAAFMVTQRLGQRMALASIDAPKTACLAVRPAAP